jgi:uncharacterized damage-inducible protein DinB
VVMQYLKVLFTYNAKFAEDIIKAMRTLDQKRFIEEKVSSWGSLRNLVMHLIEVEDYWINKVITLGDFQPYDFENFDDLDKIEKRWKKIDTDITRFLDKLTLAELNTERTVKWDKKYSYPLERILQHLYTHTVHTRGQVVAGIRALGGDVPCVDII